MDVHWYTLNEQPRLVQYWLRLSLLLLFYSKLDYISNILKILTFWKMFKICTLVLDCKKFQEYTYSESRFHYDIAWKFLYDQVQKEKWWVPYVIGNWWLSSRDLVSWWVPVVGCLVVGGTGVCSLCLKLVMFLSKWWWNWWCFRNWWCSLVVEVLNFLSGGSTQYGTGGVPGISNVP